MDFTPYIGAMAAVVVAFPTFYGNTDIKEIKHEMAHSQHAWLGARQGDEQ
jgi:hypothetical protein